MLASHQGYIVSEIIGTFYSVGSALDRCDPMQDGCCNDYNDAPLVHRFLCLYAVACAGLGLAINRLKAFASGFPWKNKYCVR